MAPTKTASRYKPHPMLGQKVVFRKRVLDDTGKTWEHWLSAARRRKEKSEKGVFEWLKAQGIAPMAAGWLAYEASRDEVADYEEPEPLVDALYSGPHHAVRPLHEAVVDALNALGDDVTVTACKTMVPAYRKHVFAEMRPSEGAVEVRLALGTVPPKGRLLPGPGSMPGERMTHRVLVRSKKDVDSEFRGWLATAYENGAGKMARSTTFAVPADFSKAVKASKTATATWASMTPAMQRDMVQWVTTAKQADTRARRQATALEKLASGKKRVY
jgi:hypothetical protein